MALARKTGQVIYLQKGDPGDKGERGAVPRGPWEWDKVADGFRFLSGQEGEEFLDYVVKGGAYYMCVESHNKTASNGPDNETYGFWEVASDFQMVATMLLLAKYIIVENLGVRYVELSEGGYIRMMDADDNVIFEVKDGNVTCKTGTFENVTVSGTISGKVTATSGKIGAFDIQSGSLQNTDGQGNITISNSGRIAAMGGGTLSAVLGYDAAGGFRNDVTKSIAGSINMALYLRRRTSPSTAGATAC